MKIKLIKQDNTGQTKENKVKRKKKKQIKKNKKEKEMKLHATHPLPFHFEQSINQSYDR